VVVTINSWYILTGMIPVMLKG